MKFDGMRTIIKRNLAYSTAVVALLAIGCVDQSAIRAQEEADARAKAEAEAMARKATADSLARIKAEEEARARAEAEAKAKAEAEAKAKAEAEARAKEIARRTFPEVYFDYDRHNIRDDQKATLAEHVKKLNDNPEFQVTIEGHCDERGTIEYNLALGQRRADSHQKFLVKAGIDAGRLGTISYGKERPVDPGHDEMAWSKNRRTETGVTEPMAP